ncbi:GntR family transcriptional regulator [Nocardia puris]|uniref:GntR family transcriptional regulator n=1 Tax=Nocardia puris TaxID=208602 RepID=A0A366DRR1_9NOCA|nr:GntR family transcriptional regulator [Nocardia puris]MBF6210734.1 GntR family transcriptional regulator [Nocardia puris]MBF6364330.1 GntR family transcriptional regulator [Nocardia puris]RBO92787.1 GntR family transcriptional regulator [Nocardia puris]
MQLVSKTYSSAEQAYRAVKERILTGALAGGELISEGEVAAELGTSRTPVREAFLRLETEGWMRLYPKRGALVVPIPPDEAEHVAHARYVVETAAVRALAVTDRAGIDAALRESLARQRELATDLDAFALADTDFHRAYVAAAGNPLLTGFYDSLRERQRRMNSLALRRGPLDVPRIIDQHAHLAALIADGDTAAFATALVEHLSGVHQLALRGL